MCTTILRRRNDFGETGLVEAFLAPQVADGAEVGQGEGEAEEIFIADVGDGVAAVFQGDSTTIPIIGGLRGGELQLSGFGVEAEAGWRR